MSAELAHQKADKHLCVELHRKVRIREDTPYRGYLGADYIDTIKSVVHTTNIYLFGRV